MTSWRRALRWLALVPSLALALVPGLALAGNPCALPAVEDGIGGTGHIFGGIGGTGHPRDGIGGTGLIPNPAQESGIGGTGIQAQGIGGTGIVGIVTGFGSVCVNGLQVHYDEATPVTVNGQPAPAGHLSVGQVVAIAAQPGRNGLRASQIAVQYAVSGPISRIDPANGQLDVLGQTVDLGASRVKGERGQALAAQQLKPGMSIRVSGLRAPDGRILASLVERPAKPVRPQVMGTPENVAGNTHRIGALILRLPPGQSKPTGPVIATLSADGTSVVSLQPVSQPKGITRIVMQGVVQQRAGNLVQLEQGPVIRLVQGSQVRNGHRDQLAPGRLVQVTASLARHDMWHVDDLEFQSKHDLARRAGAETAQPAAPRRGRSSGSADQAQPDDSDDDRKDRSDKDSRDDSSSDNSGSGSTSDNSGSDGADSDRAEKIEKVEIEDDDDASKVEKSLADRDKQDEVSVKADRSGKTETRNRADTSEKSEKSARAERSVRVERTEKSDKPEKVEKLEKAERPEKVEKLEKVERPEKVEKVEKVERPEKLERVEKIEKPERSGR
jgi:hypothetical protein